MWMSSSSGRKAKLPAASSPATASSPPSSSSRSSSSITPIDASIAACARDCATSWRHSRRSNASEALIAWKSGSWGSEKRDIVAPVYARPSTAVSASATRATSPSLSSG